MSSPHDNDVLSNAGVRGDDAVPGAKDRSAGREQP